MPSEWFSEAPEITLDREEITVIGALPPPETAADSTDAERAAAAEGRSRRFREETRQQRIEIAREAEHRFGRKVSWGVICNDKKVMFTTFSVPVMTRLRQPERLVLDTLVDAGVARSRSRGRSQRVGEGRTDPGEGVAVDVREGLVEAGDGEHPFLFVGPGPVVMGGDVHPVARGAEVLVEEIGRAHV